MSIAIAVVFNYVFVCFFFDPRLQLPWKNHLVLHLVEVLKVHALVCIALSE